MDQESNDSLLLGWEKKVRLLVPESDSIWFQMQIRVVTEQIKANARFL